MSRKLQAVDGWKSLFTGGWRQQHDGQIIANLGVVVISDCFPVELLGMSCKGEVVKGSFYVRVAVGVIRLERIGLGK